MRRISVGKPAIAKGTHVLCRESSMPASAAELSAWHATPGSFQRLRPPWRHVDVVAPAGAVRAGSRLTTRFALGPIHQDWVTEVTDSIPGERLTDVQIDGPFAEWRHVRRFSPDGPRMSRLRDEVEYRLRLGAAGDLLGGIPIRQSLEHLFAYRHQRTADDLTLHAAYRARPRLTVVISGASGLLGTELAAFLTSGGHRVLTLVRRPPRADHEVFWDPQRMALAPAQLEGADAVVHLAGRSLNAARWTEAVKREILRSRTEATSLIARTVAQLDPRPVLISNSAVGYYGDRGDEPLDEQSSPGSGFLPNVCIAWEQALQPARDADARVVVLRTGVVLSGHGGALPRMLPAYRTGLGGPLGSGHQWMSWIGLQDYLGVVNRALYDDELEGPVAAVAPPVTNREFVRALTRVLHRPGLVPLPAPALRAALGEMGERLLLDSTRVAPARLTARGHKLLYPDVEQALRAELGR